MRMERKELIFPSLKGINCGIKTMFQDYIDWSIYMLNWDDELIPLHVRGEEDFLYFFFPSSSHPRDLSKGVFTYCGCLVRENECIEFKESMSCNLYLSMVWIYHDIFLLYDYNIKKWVLSRILIP